MNISTVTLKDTTKPRCVGRVRRGFQVWKTQRKPYLTTQCTRSTKEGCFCTSHGSAKYSFGTYGKTMMDVCDISDQEYELMKRHPNTVSYNDYVAEKVSVQEFISRKLRNMKRADLQKKMEEAMTSLRDCRLDDVRNILEEISDDIPSRHMTSTPDNQQETEEFLKKKHWWAQQDKVTIRDRGSSATTSFARSEDGLYYTQNQICVGEDRYWKDAKIPESHKNSDGIVLDPETHCYITEIHLYPEASKFHCLTKRSYCDFFYNINTGYLQKSHEILVESL